MRELPPYDDLMSDGCSLAPFLPERIRGLFQDRALSIAICDPELARRMRDICVMHDRAYYYGGSKAERLAADRRMLRSMAQVGAPYWFRTTAYLAIRKWGGPQCRTPGVSWGYGGSFFQYGDRALAYPTFGPPGAAEAPKPGLYVVDLMDMKLWPFIEPYCGCSPFTHLNVVKASPVLAMWVCQGCGQEYRRRRI